MVYTIPNASAAAFTPQARVFEADIAVLAYGPALTGVQSGCAVTAQGSPNMTVAVAAGIVRVGGKKVTVAAGNVTVTAANGSNPRIDLVTVDSSGTKSATAGTAAAAPIMPAVPASSVVLAAVYVPTSDTAINTNQITDKRLFVADPGYENVIWYGAVGDDSTDNSTAVQACIDGIPTAFPTRGRTIFFPNGVYRFNTGLTFSTTSMFPSRFIGGGMPANVGNAGTMLKCNSTSMTLFTFNAGASVSQQGPTFEDIGLDGATLATTTLVSLKMTNRATFRRVSFGRAVTGLSIDSDVDNTAGGDSSWHQLDGCHFYRNTTSLECRHTYGLVINGGDIVSQSTDIGIRIGYVGSNTPSQWVKVFGMKFDGCGTAVSIDGGYCTFVGTGMEGCTTGFDLNHPVTNAISGSKNTFVNCGFGTVTTAFDVGSGCAQNVIINPNFTTVTNNYTFADATARANTIIIGHGSNEPGNLRLATFANAAPADADLTAGQCQVWFDATNGAAKLMARGKTLNGTAVSFTGNMT